MHMIKNWMLQVTDTCNRNFFPDKSI